MGLKISIEGMSCNSCAKRIEKGLVDKGLDAEVNFATKSATINNSPFDADTIIALVKEMGYQAFYTKPKTKGFNLGLPEKIGLIAGSIVAFFDMGGMLINIMNPLGVLTSAILTTICQFTVGIPFMRRAFSSLLARSLGMDMLVTLGTLSAWVLSMLIYFNFLNSDHVWFEASATVLVLVRFGKMLEEFARTRATDSMAILSSELPVIAAKVVGDQITRVSVSEIKKDDIVLVLEHESIPLDLELLDNEALINESLFTGESVAAHKLKGAELFAGTLNEGASFKGRVLRESGSLRFDNILKAVEKAQSSRAPIQDFADKVSSIFVPLVISIAILAFVNAYSLGLDIAILRAITVLVVSCPCALGLATPTAIAVAIGIAADLGVLVKEARSLQKAEELKYFIFDKTGTLTEGKPIVSQILLAKGFTEEFVLNIAASLESVSSHPLAQAILNKAPKSNLLINNLKVIPGKGITGEFEDSTYTIGSLNYLNNLTDESNLLSQIGDSGTISLLAKDKSLIAIIYFEDALKPESKAVISQIKDFAITPILISGDRQATVKQVALSLNISDYHFEISPEGKHAILLELKKLGDLAMIGDGVNDALALSEADFSVAIGQGSAAARESADLTLIKKDLNNLPKALKLAKKSMQTIRLNIFFAFSYNLVAIPLAFLGKLHPGFAGGLMALSSILVVLNSLRLRLNKF